MDGERFDRIARVLGTTPSRRGALRLLAGGALGGLLGQHRPEGVAAGCGQQRAHRWSAGRQPRGAGEQIPRAI